MVFEGEVKGVSVILGSLYVQFWIWMVCIGE